MLEYKCKDLKDERDKLQSQMIDISGRMNGGGVQ